MATHEQNIENLRSAVYGEQVRGSMIELFEEDYKLVKNGLGVGTDVTSPSSSTEGYSDGNVYLNIETQDIWKLENEAWAKKGNMKGIQTIEYTPTTGDGQYNILTITLTDGSEPIVCRIKNGETGNGVASVAVISTVGNVKTYRMTFTDGTHYDWTVQEGGHVIADEEGTVMAQQPTVQFIGANVENDTTTDPSNPVTKVTIPQGGHRIASTLPNGSIMPVGVKREVLEFNGFNVEDNPDPNHLSTVVHGQLKVCATKAEWDALSQSEKDDPNTYWVRPWADTVAFATDKTPVGTVLSVATGKTGDGISGITTPTGTFPTADYLVCNGQSVSVATYPALATYFQTRYGSTYYFGGTAPGNFSLPNWSSDFPSNGVLVMKARVTSDVITFAEVDDEAVTAENVWSAEKVSDYLYNMRRRVRKNITSEITADNGAKLIAAVAEQDLAKYGYAIGDYFTGASGQQYNLGDMDSNYGGYNNRAVVSTHHIGIVVDSKQDTPWLSSGSVTSYSASTLHSFLSGTVMNNVKSDFKAIFGGSTGTEHLLTRTEIDNAIGGEGSAWTGLNNCLIVALTEVQVYGSRVFGADGYQTGTGSKQLEIFRKFKYNDIFGNVLIWLKSLSSASSACRADENGNSSDGGVSYSRRAVGLILFH